MSTKVGRNDPCPCGSGKKYKRCHLPFDQPRKPAVELKPAVAEPQAEPENLPPPSSGQPSAAYLRELVDKVPKNKRAEYDDILAQSLEIAEYLESQDELEAAGPALELHREEFNKLLADEKAFLKQAQTLFGQERFVPLRFTPEDVRRAFEHVGGPPNWAERDKAAKILHQSIVFIADKERRTKLAMNMVKQVPHYVKAGRFMDAWIVHYCSHATFDNLEASNPFLYEMFVYGYDAWSDEKRASGEALLRELGLDPARLRSMSVDEINACLQKMSADPAKTQQLEDYYDTHPEERKFAAADIEVLEREYVALLKREDARTLLLPQAKVEPWLAKLFDSWKKAVESNPELASDEPVANEPNEVIYDLIKPILGEMVSAVFTPERIAQLVIQLENYQREVFAVDKRVAACAMTAIGSLRKETEPDKNYFLITLCYASLHGLLGSVMQQNSAQG
jgi:hypothetical protein